MYWEGLDLHADLQKKHSAQHLSKYLFIWKGHWKCFPSFGLFLRKKDLEQRSSEVCKYYVVVLSNQHPGTHKLGCAFIEC